MLEVWASLPVCQEQLQWFLHPILKPWLQLCAMRLTGGTNYLTLAVSRATVTNNTSDRNACLMSTLTFIGAALLVTIALTAPLHGQSFGFPWWKDAQFQRDLALTAEQTAKIDAVFQSTISQLRQKKEELDRHEEELSRLIATSADETLVIRQVDKVEAIRANMNKMRTLMLLHERQVLSPEQRVRLNKLHEQMVKDRGKSRGDKK